METHFNDFIMECNCFRVKGYTNVFRDDSSMLVERRGNRLQGYL